MDALTRLGGKVIAFEGPDGAGKSTAIGVLKDRLREAGVPVYLPRTGKHPTSRPARMIRELTRDRRNHDLHPRTEVALYCARETQIIEEQVRPAIARGEAVLLDRSLLTPVILGSYGRGLPFAECAAAAKAAAGGLEPDITIVLDADPRTSRIRKRLGRVRERSVIKDPSRKGFSGTAFKERIRDGYREIAAERGYPLFHTERAAPYEVAERVMKCLLTGARSEEIESAEDAVPRWMVDEACDFEAGLSQLPDDLAVYMTRGLGAGRPKRRAAVGEHAALVAWALDNADPLVEELAARFPDPVVGHLTAYPISGPKDLRIRLAAAAPLAVAKALRFVRDAEADRLRESLADVAPSEVVTSLMGRDDQFANELRARLWDRTTLAHAAASLGGCRSDDAWSRRAALFEQDPVIALRSLRGLDDAPAQELLSRYAGSVPKAVLDALTHNGSEFAHEMRRELASTGREVVDSLGRLEDDASMRLREEYAQRWPSTVLGTLTSAEVTPRVADLVATCQRAGAGDLHLLRQMAARRERADLPHSRNRFEFESVAMGE